MPSIDRRRFLTQAAAIAGAPILSSRAALGIDPIERTRPAHLKLSLAAYSFRKELDAKKITMFDVVDIAADNALDGVEPTSYWFPSDADDAYFRKLQQYAFKRGLDISGTAIRNDFCVPPGPKRDEQFAQVRRWIDRASVLGAPVIRIFGGTIPKGADEAESARLVIEGIEAVLPYAAEKGVSLALENHGGITLTPAQLLHLVRGVDAPMGNFGVNLDTGNFHGDDPYADLAQLAPYALNVQIKTEISRKGKPKEDADLSRFIAILRDAKYSGYVVLEYEAEEDPRVAVPRHLKALRALIG